MIEESLIRNLKKQADLSIYLFVSLSYYTFVENVNVLMYMKPQLKWMERSRDRE